MGKVADEGGEVRLEGVLELLLVLVAELSGEHVGDTLSVFEEDNRGSGRGKASASQCRRSAVFLVFWFFVFFFLPGAEERFGGGGGGDWLTWEKSRSSAPPSTPGKRTFSPGQDQRDDAEDTSTRVSKKGCAFRYRAASAAVAKGTGSASRRGENARESEATLRAASSG